MYVPREFKVHGSIIVLLAAVISTGCSSRSCGSSTIGAASESSRNPRWATPLDKPGLPNLHLVDEGLFRGAQPTPKGFRELAKMGVKTIVNLRSLHSDWDEIEAAGLKGHFEYVSLPMAAWEVKEEEIISFLRIATDAMKRPLFFHCMHGADRTGTIAASYRMVMQGWSADEAFDEMKNGGFEFHEVWVNLPGMVAGLDVKKVRRELGMEE